MVSHDDVKKMAKLAKLYVAQENLDELCAAMDNMLAFADQISQAGEVQSNFDSITGLKSVFREDQVVASYPREEILSNVKGGEDGFFPVQKVIRGQER